MALQRKTVKAGIEVLVGDTKASALWASFTRKLNAAIMSLLPSTVSETAVKSLAIDPEKKALTTPLASAPKVAEPPEKALLFHTRLSPGPTANILSKTSTFCDVPNRTKGAFRGADI